MTKAATSLSGLIFFCFAISLALDSATRDLLNAALGVHAAGFLRGQLWSFCTYQFLHGGWLHLLMNLATLLSVGPEIERVVGARRFLAIYFASGILGAAAWLALVWPVDSVLIGASAAICGLLGALAALRPREKYALVFLPLPLPAWLLITALAATQLAYIFLVGTDGHVAYVAHLGGGIAGFVIAKIFFRAM